MTDETEVDWQQVARVKDGLYRSAEADLAVMTAERDAALARLATLRAEVREYADSHGVYAGDDGTEWFDGYRQAQRERLHTAAKWAARVLADPEGGA